MIELKNVSKSFGKQLVLDDFNFEIKDGQIFGLIGINGSGKTTLLRIMSGVYVQDQGSVLFDGQNHQENPEIRQGLFFLAEDPYIPYAATVQSLINLYKQFYQFDEKVFYRQFEEFKLDHTKKIHNFSKGMKRQLFVSLAIACGPRYLLIDEAFDGLDPIARLKFKRAINQLIEAHNTTVIIASHSLRELEDICDSYALINENKLEINEDINTSFSKYVKYQLVFKEHVGKDSFSPLKLVYFSQVGRVLKVIFENSREEVEEFLSQKKVILVDELNVGFEDVFMIESGFGMEQK